MATATAYAPKLPGFDVPLDYYHGNRGAVPGSEEALRVDTPEPEKPEAMEEDDDEDDDDDEPLTEERKQYLLDKMDEEERADYDAADDEEKEDILIDADHEDKLDNADDEINISAERAQYLVSKMDEVERAEYDTANEGSKHVLLIMKNISVDVEKEEDKTKDEQAGSKDADANSPPKRQFPSAVVEDEWKSNTVTLRERAMMTFIDLITDKPDWNTKVHDETIVAKWKTEAQALPAEAVPGGFSDAMFDYVIAELRDKAKVFEEYGGVVSVFDAAAVVFKQDVLTADKELHEALKAAVKPLEDVPDKDKDWHPGSNEQVLDLVHPSLWPLVYGKTHVLRDRTIALDDALKSITAGEVIAVPKLKLGKETSWGVPEEGRLFSNKFQWLPAEVTLDGDKAKIASYINNLHPVQHAELYPIIERLVERALPLWDATYTRVMDWKQFEDKLSPYRIHCLDSNRQCSVPEVCKPEGTGYCDSSNRPGFNNDNDDDDDDDDDDDEDEWEANERWFNSTHPVGQPEPEEYKYIGPKEIKSTGWFDGKKNLQVIVKFANIHLTPEKPSYDGGSWHIEGQLNERICATALFYYDNTNVTDSHLSFRTASDSEEMTCNFSYEQGDHAPFEEIYGVHADYDGDSTVIEHGRVLTREGRLLVFPNVYQHRVGSFELADKTQPGHRKIVALFLVDPATPVISTANVPPQQQHWNTNSLGDRLPPEIAQIVYSEVGGVYPLTEAKKLREELIEERKALDVKADKAVNNAEWSFCEH